MFLMQYFEVPFSFLFSMVGMPKNVESWNPTEKQMLWSLSKSSYVYNTGPSKRWTQFQSRIFHDGNMLQKFTNYFMSYQVLVIFLKVLYVPFTYCMDNIETVAELMSKSFWKHPVILHYVTCCVLVSYKD